MTSGSKTLGDVSIGASNIGNVLMRGGKMTPESAAGFIPDACISASTNSSLSNASIPSSNLALNMTDLALGGLTPSSADVGAGRPVNSIT